MKCESCKINKVETEENYENNRFYKLCTDCKQRLYNYALRPLEYFNLASIHGHTNLLMSDFYEDNSGRATQPKIKVTNPEQFPFPPVESIIDNTERLIDYAFVRYFVPGEIIKILRRHDKTKVLSLLKDKVEYNRNVNHKAYEIAAKVLGSFAAKWIESEWHQRKSGELLVFSEALAKCLPADRAFKMIIEEIESLPNKDLQINISALIYFESKLTLDWIEKIAPRVQSVGSSFGVVAAASNFDWNTAKRWLSLGRPLSLIALDALSYLTETDNTSNLPLYFKDNKPQILNSELSPVIAKALQEFLKSDDKPRTRNVINKIISNLFR